MQQASNSWHGAMVEGWEAVPAREILRPDASIWRDYGVGPITRPEAVTFAAFARLFKYGQSLAMVLPAPCSETIIRLLAYSHRLRVDAIDGGIRAKWLQPKVMIERTDLVLFSRPSVRHSALARIRDLHVSLLRPGSISAQGPAKRLRTVLVDGNSKDMMEVFKAIETATKPFLFVVDGTPGGVGEEAGHLEVLMHECFPEVPCVTLAALGDLQTVDRIAATHSRSHIWRLRKGDEVLLGDSAGKPSPLLELATIQDEVANTHLACAASKLRALSSAVEKEPSATRQLVAAPLYKVFNVLRTLVMPLEQMEQALENATRGGRFPVRTLQRLLDNVRGVEFSYGETLNAVNAAHEALSAVHAAFDGALTGKAQAVCTRVKKAVSENTHTTVLAGSVLECAWIEKWIEEVLGLEGSSLVSVWPMDGTRIHAKALPAPGEVLVTGVLWPNRMHWLCMPATRVAILSYPFEAEQNKRNLLRWWEHCGQPSLPQGDKLRLWRLDWPLSGRCLDVECLALEESPLDETALAFSGKYRKSVKLLDIPMVDRHADWIEELMAEHDMTHSEEEHHAGVAESGGVWLRFADGQPPVMWPRHKPVWVLKDEDIVPTSPEDLVSGEKIVLLHFNEERVASQEALFRMFLNESEGLEEIMRFADKWQSLVDDVSKQFKTTAAIRALLKKSDIDITDQSINSWKHHSVLGPQNPKIVEVFSAAAGRKSPVKHANKLNNAIKSIRMEHRAIGRDLSRALVAHAKGAEVVQIGSIKLEASSFASLVGVCAIEAVEIPPLKPHVGPPGLVDRAAEILNRYPGRLVFTANAQRSMRASIFKDVDRFGSCLELMATRLWPMYHEGAERMHEVLPAFEARQITFAAGTSAVTQGKFWEYDRTYKGRTVDIGRHFRLGVAWDPTLTMRVHFHWEESDRQIVILHAGEHLKTSLS